MAAGLGTRLKPFTELVPKPLLPLLGVPMAQFAIDALTDAGVKNIAANIHHLPELSRAGLMALDRTDARLQISDESAKLLGSGGGIRTAYPLLGEAPFFLVNSDTLCSAGLSALARTHHRLREMWGVQLTLTVFQSGPRGGKYREIFVDAETGLIDGLGDLAEGRPYFVGAAVIEPEALAHLPMKEPFEFVPKVLLPAIQAGKAGAHFATGEWYDVGSPDLWLKAHLELLRVMETGRVPRLWRKRIEEKNLRLAQEVWIEKNSASAFELSQVTSNWVGPAYWSALAPGDRPPTHLGPRAVGYGSAAELSPASEGIGFKGTWADLRESLRKG